MRLPIEIARAYAAQHGSEFEARGLTILEGETGTHWERFEADELAGLALSEGETVESWFDRRLQAAPAHTHIAVPVTIDAGAVQVDARTTVEGATVQVKPAAVTIAKGAVHVEIKPRAGTKKITFEKKKGETVGATIKEEEP
jgi:hypothetical protein